MCAVWRWANLLKIVFNRMKSENFTTIVAIQWTYGFVFCFCRVHNAQNDAKLQNQVHRRISMDSAWRIDEHAIENELKWMELYSKWVPCFGSSVSKFDGSFFSRFLCALHSTQFTFTFRMAQWKNGWTMATTTTIELFETRRSITITVKLLQHM